MTCLTHPVDRSLVDATLERPVLRGPAGEIRVRDVIECLQAGGIGVWVNGGTPRDWLSGKVSIDIDFSLDRDLGSAHALLRKAFPGVDPVVLHMEGFGLLRWGDPDLCELDLNILRSHEEVGTGDIWSTRFVPGSDLESDCLTRDFSVNAFYYDCQTGTILDPLGCGLEDLRTRTLRLITHPKVLAVSPRTSCRIIQFLTRGYQPLPETLEYLDSRVDGEVQALGAVSLFLWISQYVIGRGGDFAAFRAILEGRVREPASREILGRVFTEIEARGADELVHLEGFREWPP
jgi:poly(A) polymerase